MQALQVLLEEPIRLGSILESSSVQPFSSLTKIIGTLGPKSRSVESIESMLRAGMSVARFDFSWGDEQYHQETLENLKQAVKNTRRLCAVMLDTVGPELYVVNDKDIAIQLVEGEQLILSPPADNNNNNNSNNSSIAAAAAAPCSTKVLSVNYDALAAAVKPGDTIFIGQYLFTGSEDTSVWLEVTETRGTDVICKINNTATLTGTLFTAHVSQVRIELPTLSEYDLRIMSTWGVRNQIDFLSLSYTRHADDVRLARSHLAKLGDLVQTQILAKIENYEGLAQFDAILKEADGIILSRGNLGIDLPPEKVFLFQKVAINKCNFAGKPAVITRVVDSMVDNPRPTRAEATDVANAVLDGADAVLLGAETLRGLYPIETITTVRRIAVEAEKVFNQAVYFKRMIKSTGEPMEHLESIASSAVRAATKVMAALIVVFTSSGRAARLIAKYRPTMPVLCIVIPRLHTNHLRWSFTGAFQARQSLVVRGLFPMLAEPRHSVETSNESILKVALDHGKAVGIVKSHDRVVIFQKSGDSSLVKIIELE
jgi:pyruvate kinase